MTKKQYREHWSTIRRLGYVPTGLDGYGSAADYQLEKVLRTRERRHYGPGCVLAAQESLRSEHGLTELIGWTPDAEDELREQRRRGSA